MRTPRNVLLLGTLLSLFAGLARLEPGRAPAQDPAQDEQDEPEGPVLPGLTAFSAREARRLEQEIEGVWLLTSFEPRDRVVDPRDVRGYASFQDGFMTLLLQGRGLDPTAFIARSPTYFAVEAGLHRFRISPELTLQTAAVMGYTNANDEGVLAFDRSGATREYTISVEDGELTLTRSRSSRFTFRRLPGGAEFPIEAIQAIERGRMGIVDEFPDRRQRR